MKTFLVFVASLDGKVTKWGNSDVKTWSSHQDQEYYRKVWNENFLIVMGSYTFNTDQKQPSADHLLMVMTGHPERYSHKQVAGQLEFTSESPRTLVSRLEKEGHKSMLIIGGPRVATSFLKDQLIDEVWLTIEPKIFGMGSNFAIGEKLDINLRLIHFDEVNKQGTLIARYEVIKNEGFAAPNAEAQFRS
jgi:dihydrofolate reductase